LYVLLCDQEMIKLLFHLQKAGLNAFFLLLLLCVLLSWLFPYYGTAHGPLPLAYIIQYGVPVIFFFYGLRLSPKQLKAGLGNWKLHLLVQSTTFLLFPAIVLLFSFLRNDPEYRLLWLGTFYLAALPSTVSSSVVMVSIARGNLSAAIFNASLSSIIGIFITPLWMSFFIKEAASTAEFTDVIVKLCFQVLVPVVIGFLLHERLGKFADKYKKTLRYFDQSIILIIIYTAFSESFYGHVFSDHSLLEIVLLAMSMLVFFLAMFGLMQVIASRLKFSREDRITILFCGSKKSLVQGALMGRLLFPDPVILGVVLLPLVLYHALQLLAGSAIAEKMSRE
jgi:solute carrier family 10 (sodium/bile acid cotransporter), member 7